MLIDVTRSINRARSGKLPTGIDRVCLAYLNNYAGKAQGVVWAYGCYHLLSAKSTQWLAHQLQCDVGSLKSLGLLFGLVIRLVKDALITPSKGDVLLQLGHSGLENNQLGPWVKKHHLKLYSMVHDLIPLSHPQFTRAGTAPLHAKRMLHMLRWSSGILANSQFTLDCLKDYAKTEGLSLPPSLVTHLPPAEMVPPLEVPPIITPYFVILGTIEARKNHALMLKVWQKLIELCGENTPKLVIIGQRGWSCDEVFELLDHDPMFKAHVLELGTCSDKELSTWVGHARALLFPSFIEGYGIPLVEALMLGTPVIASSLAVFHEISGSIPRYLEPDDDVAWLDAVIDFLNPSSESRRNQIGALKKYSPPSWDSNFESLELFISQNH